MDLDDWFKTLVEEQYDAECDDKAEWMERFHKTCQDTEDYCMECLECYDLFGSFKEAISNTVNWQDVHKYIHDYAKENPEQEKIQSS